MCFSLPEVLEIVSEVLFILTLTQTVLLEVSELTMKSITFPGEAPGCLYWLYSKISVVLNITFP